MKVFLTLFFYLTTSLLFAESFKILGSGDQERIQVETTIKEYEDRGTVSSTSSIETTELIYLQSSAVFYQLQIFNHIEKLRLEKLGVNNSLRVTFLDDIKIKDAWSLDRRADNVKDLGLYQIYTSNIQSTIIGALVEAVILHAPIIKTINDEKKHSDVFENSANIVVKFLEHDFKQKVSEAGSSEQKIKYLEDGKEILEVEETFERESELSVFGKAFNYLERSKYLEDVRMEKIGLLSEKKLYIRREGSEINFLNELLGKIYDSEDIGISIGRLRDKKLFLVQLSIRKEKVNQIIKSVQN
jgi:hypothetical protein